MEPRDIEPCLAITREGFAFDPARQRKLLSLWKELLASGDCVTVVVEDRRLPAEKRQVGFGMSVFVTDAFARQARAGMPFLSRGFLDQWAQGNRVHLSKKEVAAANSGGGLNLMVLHYGWKEESLTPGELAQVRHQQTECFIQSHAGYKTKEYLHEVFGPELRDFLIGTGSFLRQHYAGAQWKAALKGTAKKDWPYLMGFTAQEVMAQSGTTAAIFQSKALEPHLGFSPGEQEMLGKALLGETDERLAKTFGLSPWTIKKRWQSVYLKVAMADPELLGANLPAGKREPQKRRHLLEYLRQHPEELRDRKSVV